LRADQVGNQIEAGDASLCLLAAECRFHALPDKGGFGHPPAPGFVLHDTQERARQLERHRCHARTVTPVAAAGNTECGETVNLGSLFLHSFCVKPKVLAFPTAPTQPGR
jgi:hypothetical protein